MDASESTRGLASKIAAMGGNIALGVDKGGNMTDSDEAALQWRQRRLRCLLEYAYVPTRVPSAVVVVPTWRDIAVWHGYLRLSAGLWHSMSLPFVMTFPEEYPCSTPPSLRFLVPVWHPSVDATSGVVHLESLLQEYQNEISAVRILSLLPKLFLSEKYINTQDAWNQECVLQIREDKQSFMSVVQEHRQIATQIHDVMFHSSQMTDHDADQETRERFQASIPWDWVFKAQLPPWFDATKAKEKERDLATKERIISQVYDDKSSKSIMAKTVPQETKKQFLPGLDGVSCLPLFEADVPIVNHNTIIEAVRELCKETMGIPSVDLLIGWIDTEYIPRELSRARLQEKNSSTRDSPGRPVRTAPSGEEASCNDFS